MTTFKEGDIIQRNYKYEIRVNSDGQLYAHILDGSNYHLSMKDTETDFKKAN